MIELNNLDYKIADVAIFQRLTLKIAPGQHTLLLGASGSGKTTLLHLLAGILSPQSGEIKIDGRDILALRGAQADAWRGQNIGMVFQTLHLVKALTVQDNLRLAQMAARKADDINRIHTLLQSLGVRDKAHSYPHQLSVGQAQRVAIARAVVNNPRWILADEPTSALDDHHCAETLKLLESQAAQCHATLIIATHDQRIKHRFSHMVDLEQICIEGA